MASTEMALQEALVALELERMALEAERRSRSKADQEVLVFRG